jgi:hypothetical protein
MRAPALKVTGEKSLGLLDENTVDDTIFSGTASNFDSTFVGLNNRTLGEDVSADVVGVARVIQYGLNFGLEYLASFFVGYRNTIFTQYTG